MLFCTIVGSNITVKLLCAIMFNKTWLLCIVSEFFSGYSLEDSIL